MIHFQIFLIVIVLAGTASALLLLLLTSPVLNNLSMYSIPSQHSSSGYKAVPHNLSSSPLLFISLGTQLLALVCTD